MNAFIALPEDRRRRFCEEAQMKLGLPPRSIEKDFGGLLDAAGIVQTPAVGCSFHLQRRHFSLKSQEAYQALLRGY